MGFDIARRPVLPKGGRIHPVAAAALTLGDKHTDKIIRMDYTAAACTLTLPPATGSGRKFEVVIGAVNTNGHVIQVTGDDTLKGQLQLLDNDSTAATSYAASGTDDTLTLNGTTTGGQIGDTVIFTDIKADVWSVRGQAVVPAGSNIADPFSAAVS